MDTSMLMGADDSSFSLILRRYADGSQSIIHRAVDLVRTYSASYFCVGKLRSSLEVEADEPVMGKSWDWRCTCMLFVFDRDLEKVEFLREYTLASWYAAYLVALLMPWLVEAIEATDLGIQWYLAWASESDMKEIIDNCIFHVSFLIDKRLVG
jgi:hypothetical protein